MAASDFENPRRDKRWDESPGKLDDPGRGSYGASSGGRASGSQRYGYEHEPVYRAPPEGGARPEEHGSYRSERPEHEGRADRPDPSHRFDPDYHEWRAEQMRQLDKDYALWRQERYQKFAEEFETWRRHRFSGEQRPAPGARAGAAGPSFPPAARSSASGFRGPGFGSANALGTTADSPTAEPAASRPRPERSERPEAADRTDRPDRPEKSGGILSGLLGTGSSRK